MTELFRNRRILWIGITFIAGMAAGSLIFERVLHMTPATEKPAPVTPPEQRQTSGRIHIDTAAQKNVGLAFAQAETRPIGRTLQATGVVSPNESRLVRIKPLARGRIESVNVRLGDRVRAGQVLLVYDNIELGEVVGQYSAALAALDKAKADAEVTRRSLERAKALVDIGALTRAEFEKRSAEYKNALASIESQTADLAKTDEKLHRFGLTEDKVKSISPHEGSGAHRMGSQSRLTAPFDGVVIKYNAAAGQAFGPEDEVFVIADLSTVWVLADLYEKDIASVQRGQDARIVADSYQGETFRGRITNVSDFLDPKTRTAKVRCEVPNADGKLKLDMFVVVQLPAPGVGQAIMIPTTAVQQINDRPVVFVQFSATEFEARNVDLGSRSDAWVEVKSGVKDGERVATTGGFYLKSTMLRAQIGGEE
ncbi:MAG: efflux RND transporter periplasmic adaptor subunit [Acidobacteria bacterium]|nr:efflux RND transporter periplasmic adaptor subunit [Acidobacteriota bacterium]